MHLKKGSRLIFCCIILVLFHGIINAEEKPNILLAIGDDISWEHLGAYGCTFVKTPTFDALAKNGVKFTNAFSSAPGCSPSRAALLTGRNIWEIEEAGTHASNFPIHLKVYPEILETVGYMTGYTGKPWGPGNCEINGRKENPAGKEYNNHSYEMEDLPASGIKPINYAENFKEFLNKRPNKTPFCFWYGAKEAHRGFEFKSGVKNGKSLGEAVVPGFLPDTETVRHDLLDYAIEIEWFDTHLGKMINLLKEAGELENTIIVVTADNGMPFPRAKINNYEYGVHMPLIISCPKYFPANRVVDDLVCLPDLAPTFLEIAGSSIPSKMSAKSLLPILKSDKNGLIDKSRKYVMNGKERHTHARADNLGYPVRAIHTQKYTYIRNLKPERSPVGLEGRDSDNGMTGPVMKRNPDSKLTQLAFGIRPLEELYNRQSDPYCLNNLAENPEYRSIMDKMWNDLKRELTQSDDPRMLGYGDVWESYPRYHRMRDYPGFKEAGEYNPKYVEKALREMKKQGVSNPKYEKRASKNRKPSCLNN